MSIFTHTFPRYVRKQLQDREAILKIGNNLSENRFSKQGRFPAGAFYTNTVEKQCIIRMCSGVDLSEEGEKNILSTKLEKDNWKGANLAKNWILEGGMPDVNIVTEANIDELTAAKKKSTKEEFDALKEGDIASSRPRAGMFNQKNKQAYGDPSTCSDKGDGFGIVPMPGIIDAKVKVKSAYGSLREAQVNFVCHNRRQLEILELLYMRPGYTLLLEWGWTPHIKTTVKKDNTEGAIIKSNDFFIMNEFFDANQTFSQLNKAILDKKQASGGNYDAMCGYIKNFEIKVREDGGYDCSTTIISMGELLEGLKGRSDFGIIKSKEDEEGRIYDNFEVYMMALKQKMKSDTDIEEFKDEPAWNRFWKNFGGRLGMDMGYEFLAAQKANPYGEHDISAEMQKAFESIFSPNSDIQLFAEGESVPTEAESKVEDFDASEETNRDNSGWGWLLTPAAAYWAAKREINHVINVINVSKDKIKDLDSTDKMDHFLLHKGEQLGLGKDGDFTLGKAQHDYIRWDFLCELMNEFVLDNVTGTQGKDENTGPVKKALAKIAYTNEGEESPDDIGHYLDYANYSFSPSSKIPIDLKTDSADSTESNQEQGLGIVNVDLSEIMDGSLNPSICLFPHQISPHKGGKNTRKKLGTILLGKKKWFEAKSNGNVAASNRSIGLIYINIDHLLNTYREMRYDSNGGDNEKWSILEFMKKIWEEDITGACAGTHNFIFQMPNSVGRVIDVTFDGAEPNDVHTLKIQSQDSTVRDFNFNTTIDKKLSSTIAIAAQSPKSISNLDQLSFAAFNKNIKNRFVQQERGTDESRERRETIEKDVQSFASQLYNYHLSLVQDNGEDNDKKNQTINVENAVQKILSLQQKVIELTLTYPLKCGDKEEYVGTDDDGNLVSCTPGADHPAAGKRRGDASVSKSSIIPLKFNAKMDGIGGIVIGNIFKLPKSRLPKGYNGDDIAFVVMGINHQITDGQDWTTEISGQLILLSDPSNITSTGTYTLSELEEHGNFRTYNKSTSPGVTVIDGVTYRNKRENAAKVVALFDNNYDDSVLEDLDIKLAPGGDALDGFITEKVGSSDGTDPFPQLDSGGDISPQLADVAVAVFTKIKEYTDDPPGTLKKQQWTGEKSQDTFGIPKIRGRKNPYHIIVTGGNDQWHHDKSPNSNHCQGMGLDFVVTPDERKYRDEIEMILKKFAVANEGRFRYINEYADGGNPSGKASGDHFHITWYPSKIGNDGLDEYNAAKKLAEEGKLWAQDLGPQIFAENKKSFIINTVEYKFGSQQTISATNNASMVYSDERLKINTTKVGNTEYGIPLYEFNYKNTLGLDYTSRFRGIMAQDLLKTNMSKAVILNNNGYYSIDYDQLNINLEKIS